MASSGNFENAFRSGYALRVEWSINSQSIENNTSSVTVTAYLVSKGSSYTINSSASKTVNLVINGTTYTKTASGLASLSGNQKKSLLSKTVTITHNADGSKSIPIYCTFGLEVTLSGTYWGTVRAPASGNGTAVLNTIPRATTPTTSGTFNVGNTITINTPRASSNFDHKVFYSLNNSTWTLIKEGVTTSTTWTLPSSLATAKTNATSGTVYIRCATMNKGAFVGNVTITRTYSITSAYAAPSVSVSASQTNSASIAQYIRGISSVTLKASATLKYSATPAKYVFKYGGTTKTVASTSTSASVTFTLPSNAAASYSYSVTLTDSRGYTASSSGTLSTVAYSIPQITSISAIRGDYNGTTFAENSKGESLQIAAAGTITSLSNANAKNYKIEYRLATATAYTTLIDTKAAAAYSVSIVEHTDAIFSENSAYVVRVTFSDSFNSVSRVVDVSSQRVLMNFSANGKAMCIGGIATVDNALQIALEAYATGGIKPVELAEGTNFDEVVKTGLYIGNAASGGYVNCPMSTGTFLLEVSSGGGVGQLIQRYSFCSKDRFREYVRCFYQSAWGEWKCVATFGGKVLWSGGYYMTEGHTASLSEAVSDQPNGIVLVFSTYAPGSSTVYDTNWQHFFVSKHVVSNFSNTPHTFPLAAANFSALAAKVLYIKDAEITGHANNSATGSASTGITYANNNFVLRFVIGV